MGLSQLARRLYSLVLDNMVEGAEPAT
eukprot:SAG31_NODE_42930_length_269_cov_0.905882_2_plen_26_part_01